MTTLSELEKELIEIKKRNARVEMDKTWEGSWTRKLLLIIFTYITIGLYLHAIQVANPWINAIVPATGFFISTLTLPYFRSLWEKFVYNR